MKAIRTIWKIFSKLLFLFSMKLNMKDFPCYGHGARVLCTPFASSPLWSCVCSPGALITENSWGSGSSSEATQPPTRLCAYHPSTSWQKGRKGRQDYLEACRPANLADTAANNKMSCLIWRQGQTSTVVPLPPLMGHDMC